VKSSLKNRQRLPIKIIGKEPYETRKDFEIGLDETRIDAITISDDEKIVVESSDTIIRVWDRVLGKLIQILEGHCEPIYFIALSSDGQRVLSKTLLSAKMWDIETGEELLTNELPFDKIKNHNEEYYKAKVDALDRCHRLNFFGDHDIKVYKKGVEVKLYDGDFTAGLSFKEKQSILDKILFRKRGYDILYADNRDLIAMDSKRVNILANFGKVKNFCFAMISSDGSKVVLSLKDRSYLYDVHKGWRKTMALIKNKEGCWVKFAYNSTILYRSHKISPVYQQDTLMLEAIKRENRLKRIKNMAVFADGEQWQKTLLYKMSLYETLENDITDYKEGWIKGECGQSEDDRIEGISLPFTIKWQEHQLNIMNISNFSDLEIFSFLQPREVIESSVTMFSAVLGVQTEVESIWNERVENEIPTIVFLTQMNKKEADFLRVLKQMHDKLKANPLLLHLPINGVDVFEGVIDLIKMRELIWGKWTEPFGGYLFKEFEIRDELLSKAQAYRYQMLEQLAKVDGNENLKEKLLSDKVIGQDEIIEAIRVATLSMSLTPILLGCASETNGIQLLLDAIINYLPSSIDISLDNSPMATVIKAEEKREFIGVVIGIVSNPFVGELAIVRVYRGLIKIKSTIYNLTQQREDKVDIILKMYAIKIEEIYELGRGEIGSFGGLKGVKIGDVLCDMNGN